MVCQSMASSGVRADDVKSGNNDKTHKAHVVVSLEHLTKEQIVLNISKITYC